MESLPTAFYALKSYKQFIVHKDKKPANYTTGAICDAHDPTVWTDADTAILAAKRLGYGVGFVLTESDPFFLLDIDKAHDGHDWSDLSKELITTLAGAGVEVSTSGRGLHIIGCTNDLPHGCRNSQFNLELYTNKRFIALTGIYASGNVGFDCTSRLTEVIDKYFSVFSVSSEFHELSDGIGPSDIELIEKALASQSIKAKFGQESVRFIDLWENNEAVLTKFYPPNDTDIYNRSSADAALASHLAFWTNKDETRIERLMRQSKLVRDKWDRSDYLPRTISSACGKISKVFTITRSTDSSSSAVDGQEYGELINHSTILSIPEQRAAFKGCVYICDENSIFMPGGQVLDKERFNVMQGGKTYVIDPNNSKVSKSAWEAFTQNQGVKFPRVDSATFLPDKPPGEIITRDGLSMVNTYWPLKTPRIKGDVSPFLRHMDKLFPDSEDNAIMLNYIAALVQFMGRKFQWCPVIQGVRGNGKTFISLCVANIIGMKYTAFPRADQISSNFNDWQYRTIFVPVEDFYNPSSKVETMEILKPMMTLDRQMIEGKGKTKIMRDICCNYIINTNHKEALRKTRDERCFSVFFTPQQSIDDLKRDGMLDDYFPNLIGWAKHKDGFAMVCDYMLDFPIIDKYNPLLCPRAPRTSTTEQAITESLGTVENEIIEAIDQDRIGFRKGWVNSNALNALLESTRLANRVPHNRRRTLLQALGYDWHPHLTKGRVSNVMPGENTRPILYISKNHKHRDIRDNNQIINAYLEDQKEC